MSDSRFWMQTYTKRPFRFDDTSNLDINIKDIARPLSRIPRFGGHTTTPISVAEHSLVAVRMVNELKPNCGPLVKMHALLHDAHEAFYGDIPSPLKRYLLHRWRADFNDLMAEAQTNILGALGIPLLTDLVDTSYISNADLYCLCVERHEFMDSNLEWDIDRMAIPLKPHWRHWYLRFSPSEAYRLFLEQYHELREELHNADG